MTQSIRSSPAFFAAGRRTWNIAVYIRLSREDARSPAESESVANQRAIIEEHIAAFDDGDEYRIAGEYVDDGISGTTDDGRDGFQRMLSDILCGRINCVIVKDLARSFRNYSDQGYYLDDWCALSPCTISLSTATRSRGACGTSPSPSRACSTKTTAPRHPIRCAKSLT